MKKILLLLIVLLAGGAVWFFFLRDSGEGVPKPRGYFRIDLPERGYVPFQSSCLVNMELPTYSKVEVVKDNSAADSCWFNVYFPRFNARVHCTYLPVRGNTEGLINAAYNFAMTHEVKASALKRTRIDDPARKVYGMIYDIEGEAASQLQFYATDSSNHFLRGSLYFFNRPNPDSIAPVLEFLREDIVHLCNTIQWR